MDFGSVDMPEREMMKKVVESEDCELFLQKFSPLRPYAFQVFNGIRQYVGGCGNNDKIKVRS